MTKRTNQNDAKAINSLTVEHYAAVLNAIPAHVALLDNNGVILALNEAWRRFATANVLQSADFFVGQNYLDVCEGAHGECADEAMAVATGIRKVLSGETKEFVLEYPCHSPNEQRWYRLMVTPLSETPGTGAVVMHLDVTQHSLAEKLGIETRRLHESQAVSNIGSWETDLTTFKVTWTDGTHRIFETSPEEFEVSHQGFLERVHPEDRERVDAAFLASVGEPGPFAIEHRLLMPDGRIKIVEERWQTFTDATGKPERALGTCQDITERKRSETERSRVFNLSLDLLAIGSFDGELEQVNPAWTECLGWSAEELTIRPWLDFVHPDDQAATIRSAETIASGTAVRDFENRYRCKDGSYRWLSWNAHPLMETRQMFCVARDVTERRKSEAQLHLLETCISRLNDIVLITEAEPQSEPGPRILYVNDAFVRRTGFTREDVIGKTPRILQGPKTQRDALDRIRAALHAWQPVREELINYTKSGEEFWLELDIVPVADEKGWFTHWVAIERDVTERKRTQEALADSQRRYRDLVETSYNVIWSVDMEGRFTFLNQASRAVFGRAPEEMIGRRFHEFVPEDQHQANDEIFARLFRDGQDVIDYSNRIRRADGSIAILNSNARVVRDAEGQRIGISGMSQDISEQKASELEITRTNRALKMLSACNEALVHAVDESDLLKVVCEIAVASGGYRMAWVGYAQEDARRTVQPMAHAGEEAGFLSDVAISWEENSPDGSGPAGRTIRTGQPSVSEDVEQDASFHWRDAARHRGYRSVMCLPLRSGDRTFGLLGLYSGEALQTGAEELKLLQELADNLAFGIGHLRAQRETERIHRVVTRVASVVSAGTGAEFLEQLAESMAEALGGAGGFVAEMLPGEPLGARLIAAVVDGKKIDNFDYAIADTPCAQLLVDDEYVLADRVAELFPKSTFLASLGAAAYVGRSMTNAAGEKIGLIFVLFREPLKETAFITSTLRIFAARATSELERQKSDNQLREQAALLDAAHDAILVRDLDDRVLYWNKGAERLYGWISDEVIGREASGFLYGDLAEVKGALQELLKKDRWEGELHNVGKDGRPILVRASWTLLRDSDGRPRSVLAINSDITEKKKLEAQFLRAQRMESIGTLAGGIAHDLNNVLAPIVMSVSLLQLTAKSEEDQELLATMLSSAQRGANLVSQVLSFARGVEGQRIPVNVGHLIRELVRVMRETFPKNLTIESEPPANLWSVLGDPTQIHQVILNLCVNARDAMPIGGTLMISAESIVVDDTYASMNLNASPGSYVVIKVEDSGTGIPPELAERVFEPFFTTKETGKGTGLGLSTTSAIVKSHGGFINLYSEVGKGAKFKVYFPADAPEEASEVRAIEQTRLPRGNGELVLVVDDEESIRSVAKSTLERFGYSVMVASHGAEGIAIYAQHQSAIAVILTDMAMPIMDGPTMIIALKSINPKVRIIGSSGLSLNAGGAKAVGAGVEHFIPKPYTAEAMLKAIRASLDSR